MYHILSMFHVYLTTYYFHVNNCYILYEYYWSRNTCVLRLIIMTVMFRYIVVICVFHIPATCGDYHGHENLIPTGSNDARHGCSIDYYPWGAIRYHRHSVTSISGGSCSSPGHCSGCNDGFYSNNGYCKSKYIQFHDTFSKCNILATWQSVLFV
jgi:hypothetical protein